jgi:hypothetical protein
MFSQVKHHDHGDRGRDQARLSRSLPGLSIMLGGFDRIAGARAGEWPWLAGNPGGAAQLGSAGKLTIIPFW